MGLIGRFWRPSGHVVRLSGREDFESFHEPGFVKAAMSFALRPDGRDTLALTETRVAATDAGAKRAFRRYWLVVRPFSGLIRRAWLLAVARRTGKPAGGRRADARTRQSSP